MAPGLSRPERARRKLLHIFHKLRDRVRRPYDDLMFRVQALTLRWQEGNGTGDGKSSLPVPPPLLRFRVHGSFDRDEYLRIGEICGGNVIELLEKAGRDLHSFSAVLDFGCGSGRVLRTFRDRPASCRLYGTDVDRQAIEWCQKHLDIATWSTNQPFPPTTYPDQTFDFIFAISVFTHLDEPMQFAWLKELKRISKPGAVLVLTVHGAGHAVELKADLPERGFLFVVDEARRGERAGLPDYYQTTFHSRAYIEQEWSKLFTVVHYGDRAIGGVQDAVVLLNQ